MRLIKEQYMRPLNIFTIDPSVLTDHLPHGDGICAYGFLRRLAERGHQVYAASPCIEVRGTIPDTLHLYPIAAGQIPGLGSRLAYMYAVRTLFDQLRPSVMFDIVQQMNPGARGLSLAMMGTRTALIIGPYASQWPADASRTPRAKQWSRSLIARLQQSQAAALLVCCPAAADIIASPVLRNTRTHILYPGVDCAVFTERESIPDKPSILFLANVETRKGIYTLLRAFGKVASFVPECTLEIWGKGGEEENNVRTWIGHSDFRDRITIHGMAPRDRVGEIMRTHSVYCLPSHGEPFGLSLLEALASGVPIITTDVGGPPFIIRAEGGRLVPIRDPERLADALIEVLQSIELQKAMGTYNRARAEQEFDWSVVTNRLEMIFGQVLEHGK
jgi:glycosyltransferase involved in cell wall biosynthesis